jgi:Fe-S oxidoreductase
VIESLAGFEQLLALGPACAHTILVRYPEVGVHHRLKVSPFVDLLAAHADKWRSLATPDPRGRRYAYHDPCFLGRRLGRYEEPRAALRAALGDAPVELGYRRSESLCAGGGGIYPLTHPEKARACAGRVLDLFRETKAHVLVTACPSAHRQLRLADPSADVQSLVAVLAERTASYCS